MAVANYHDTYGSLPCAYVPDAEGKPMHSWRVLLLPFLEQGELYKQYDFDEPWDGPNNRKLLARRPSLYAFHDNREPGGTATNYLAVVGDETVWPGSRAMTMREIRDGSEATILIVENHGGDIPWTAPKDLDFSTVNLSLAARAADGVSSRYAPPAVVTVAGAVRTLALDLPPQTLRALLTAGGGEDVSLDGAIREIPDGRDRPVAEDPAARDHQGAANDWQ